MTWHQPCSSVVLKSFVSILVMATLFQRPLGTDPRAPLSEQEKPVFYQTMRRTVVMTHSSTQDHTIWGTGFVIDSQFSILTCAESIVDVNGMTMVRFCDEENFENAEVIIVNRQNNMAILRPVNHRGVSNFVNIHADGDVYEGMEAFCIGHPVQLCYSFLMGQVVKPRVILSQQSRLMEELRRVNVSDKWTVMQLNNIHGHGATAGAPIFNSRGSVIGMWAFNHEQYDYAFIHHQLRRFIERYT